jgi:formylmethanofuran--tetrahydromethanopterin N-formyltransferase
MELHGIPIADTFAEGFAMVATRVLITASTSAWAERAARAFVGFGTSVIACGVEAAVERPLAADETPDGREGFAALLFAVDRGTLEKQVVRRLGQCVLTCPTTAAFSGLAGGKRIALGSKVRQFGDGWQISKWIGERRYWRIPVMDGEFLCEATTGTQKGIGGGNYIVLARDAVAAAAACEVAYLAMARVRDCIAPFPGGVARSGSKVGSKYPGLMASTNDAFAPTLRGVVATQMPDAAGAALEIVIDGLTAAAVREAMVTGIKAICRVGKEVGIVGITAGNYGGKLGQYQFALHEVLA